MSFSSISCKQIIWFTVCSALFHFQFVHDVYLCKSFHSTSYNAIIRLSTHCFILMLLVLYLKFHLFINLFIIYLSVEIVMHLSIYISFYLFIDLSLYLLINMFFLNACIFIDLSSLPFINLFIPISFLKCNCLSGLRLHLLFLSVTLYI